MSVIKCTDWLPHSLTPLTHSHTHTLQLLSLSIWAAISVEILWSLLYSWLAFECKFLQICESALLLVREYLQVSSALFLALCIHVNLKKQIKATLSLDFGWLWLCVEILDVKFTYFYFTWFAVLAAFAFIEVFARQLFVHTHTCQYMCVCVVTTLFSLHVLKCKKCFFFSLSLFAVCHVLVLILLQHIFA